MAFSGEEALRVVATLHPTAVLLDIGMPGVDGYQLCRKLRRDPAGRDTKLVGVTGYGAPQNRPRALEAGFDPYLLRPIDLDTLNALLAQPSRHCRRLLTQFIAAPARGSHRAIPSYSGTRWRLTSRARAAGLSLNPRFIGREAKL